MSRYGNRQKHLNPNPVQRFLLNRFHKKIVELVRQTGAACLLDTGCGEGFVIKHLQKNILPLHSFGGDFDTEALLWGRKRVKHKTPLVNLDIQQLPFPDNSFPLVICLEVLEHLPDSSLGLRELVRVSSEYVLLSTPHEPFFRGANFLRGKHLKALGNDPEHLQNFSGRALQRMLNRAVDIVWHGYAFPWQIALVRKRRDRPGNHGLTQSL